VVVDAVSTVLDSIAAYVFGPTAVSGARKEKGRPVETEAALVGATSVGRTRGFVIAPLTLPDYPITQLPNYPITNSVSIARPPFVLP
jgi:hypothetical protein